MTAENAVFANPNSPQTKNIEPPKVSFDVPVDEVSLPSAGKLYPPNHALHNAESVEIRCMTAREEDLITSAAIIKQNLVYQKLLSACLMNKSIDVNSLLVGDRNALLVAIRVVSYGGEMKARVTCPACDHEFESLFYLNKLPIKSLGAEPVAPNVNLFEFVLPLSKARVRFRLMTVGDLHDMQQAEERKRKAKIAVENRVTSGLTTLVSSINGEEDKGKIAQMILNMRAGDSRALRSHMNKIEPGIDLTQATDCPSCTQTSEVNVPLGVTFLWPEL